MTQISRTSQLTMHKYRQAKLQSSQSSLTQQTLNNQQVSFSTHLETITTPQQKFQELQINLDVKIIRYLENGEPSLDHLREWLSLIDFGNLTKEDRSRRRRG